jgi:TP53 regulating kinase-like protein
LRLIYRGAEADLILGKWSGLEAVYKMRNPLPYRLRELDDAIRAQRTIHEAQLMHQAKVSGVRTPFLYYVEPPNALLVMEFIRGKRLKEKLASMSSSGVRESFRKMGSMTGLLHLTGMMHGDLTTSNVLVSEGELVLIDFGLAIRSKRLEDHAVDLRLIKETLTGAHPKVSNQALESLFDGYGDEVGEKYLRAVTRQLRNIEKRGRYARAE